MNQYIVYLLLSGRWRMGKVWETESAAIANAQALSAGYDSVIVERWFNGASMEIVYQI